MQLPCFLLRLIFSYLSSPGLVSRVRIKGSRRRSWCSRTRRPAECGCAPARTPPPKSWCWTPVSRRTCWTASTPATPTWFASRVCQVGRRCSVHFFHHFLCRLDSSPVIPYSFLLFSSRRVGVRLPCRRRGPPGSGVQPGRPRVTGGQLGERGLHRQ